MANFIIPECYVDTNLVETLIDDSACNHQKGCNQVCKTMIDKFAERFAVGIIDADKRKPTYLSEFVEVGERGHIKILKHKKRAHYIILISPAIDKFILDCANEIDVDIRNYQLSPILSDFTKQTKNIFSNKDQRFKSLFFEMEKAGEILTLKRLLNYFQEAQYSASTTTLLGILRDTCANTYK